MIEIRADGERIRRLASRCRTALLLISFFAAPADAGVTGQADEQARKAKDASGAPNITGTIEILRAGTSGGVLHVSDMYELKNDSNATVTRRNGATFDVYLPADAKLTAVLAAGPRDAARPISATPVRGEAGHYEVNFPLRPGETKFAFNYDLPYDGHASFRTRLAYPLQQLAVMLPATMRLQRARGDLRRWPPAVLPITWKLRAN